MGMSGFLLAVGKKVGFVFCLLFSCFGSTNLKLVCHLEPPAYARSDEGAV